MSLSALLLLLAATSSVHSEQLTQPASVTLQPGQTLTINCQVSYSVTSYSTAWIRQPSGKGLEWINVISSGGSTDHKESLKNKFSVSRDTSSTTITLQGKNMQPEDSAVYYSPQKLLDSGELRRAAASIMSTMTASLLLLLMLAVTYCTQGIELIQPSHMVVSPGQSVSISCKVSGFSISSYCPRWIRQPAGKPLEWIGSICGDGSSYVKDSLKSKISFTADSSSKTVFLKAQNFQTEDTAKYQESSSAVQPQKHSMILTHLLGLLLIAASCVRSDVVLTQPSSMMTQPGQTLRLTCNVAGYSLTDSCCCTGWVRQPAGKALEWIALICSGGNTYYSDKLKNKFSISRDTSSSTVTLQGQNLQAEDTAVYYCARYPR
ncbi:hypothetical protein ACEWY4_003174 [Coilia grayii]|uniref:Ig-like domain-containing protein n=1 Tax=Coilia grayii TaxID=363190 RepID=A0ABD1KQJ3_9TELE